jgi:hypothetical protein
MSACLYVGGDLVSGRTTRIDLEAKRGVRGCETPNSERSNQIRLEAGPLVYNMKVTKNKYSDGLLHVERPLG